MQIHCRAIVSYCSFVGGHTIQSLELCQQLFVLFVVKLVVASDYVIQPHFVSRIRIGQHFSVTADPRVQGLNLTQTQQVFCTVFNFWWHMDSCHSFFSSKCLQVKHLVCNCCFTCLAKVWLTWANSTWTWFLNFCLNPWVKFVSVIHPLSGSGSCVFYG